jgi:hypothetical protein
MKIWPRFLFFVELNSFSPGETRVEIDALDSAQLSAATMDNLRSPNVKYLHKWINYIIGYTQKCYQQGE